MLSKSPTFPHREEERLMPSKLGSAMQQRVETRWENSPGRLPLTSHSIEAAGWFNFSVTQG
jgi:hypothetical protein